MFSARSLLVVASISLVGCQYPSSTTETPIPRLPTQAKHPNSDEINFSIASTIREGNITKNNPSAKPKFSHKGVPWNREIDNYSDKELSSAIQDEISIVLNNVNQTEQVSMELRSLGYGIKTIAGDTITVKLPESGISSIRRHYKKIDKINGVRFTGPRIRYQISETTPNDYNYYSSHQIDAINARTAWDYHSIRTSNFSIGILDTGVKSNHEDLIHKLVPGVEAIRSWYGWVHWYGDTNDYQGHGTHVAGIAAAYPDNNLGTPGTGWGSNIMPLAVNDPRDSKYIASDCARSAGIWAIDRGAKVLNCSFGGPNSDPFLADLVQYAQDRNVVLVCATGNESRNTINYPAAYGNQNIIAVGSINTSTLTRSDFSNHGSNIDIVAPGQNIYSTVITPAKYDYLSGTSMAAPFVSGAFASLWYACRALPYSQVRDIMFATSRDLGNPGWDQEYGHGLLNFGAAANFLLGSGVVYRWKDGGSLRRAWSSNPAEKMASNYEGLAFGLRTSNVPNTTPLYRKYNPHDGNRLLTSNTNEAPWYNNEGVIGYIGTFHGAAGMTLPVYRLYSPQGNGHMFTTNESEKNSLASSGWVYEGVIGYAW